MKHTLQLFLSIIILFSGINSFAESKANDNLACPTATISYSSTMYCSSSNMQTVTLMGTDAYLGGVFSASPAGLVINSATGAIVPSSSTPGTYTITYTIAAGSGCPSFDAMTTVTISEQIYAGTDGSITVCETSTTPINLFDLITGEQPGGIWVRIAGTGGTFNAASGIYTPALGANQVQIFNYTIIGSAPCIDDTSVAIVYLNAQPNPGFDGETWVSENSATPVNLFDLITNEQPGGTWTQTSGTGGTFNALAATFTPSNGCTTSTFTYNLVGVAPCIDDLSVATVHIDAVPVGIPSTNNQTITNGNFSNIILSSSNVPSSNFTWTFVANNISGATNGSGTTISQQLSLIDANADGYVDYTITPINNTATGSSFAARVSIQFILNSETFTSNNIKFSPNPATDILNIENDFQINSIKIYNQLGQEVYTKDVKSNQIQLNLSAFTSGIYSMLIESENGIFTQKIIKQ